MILFTGAVVVLLAGTTDARIGNSTEPGSYCTETKECLLFDLVCHGHGYEVRHYEAMKVVSTESDSYFMEVALTKGLRKLYRYISGENEAGVKIDITTPFIIKVKEGYPMWNSTLYVVSFVLPSAYQTAAPKPIDSTVYLAEMPDMNVYVKSYGGWMVTVTSILQAHLLKELLNSVQASYYRDYRYDTAYDSPLKLMNRHNEVWYVVQGMPVCATSV